MPKTMKADVDVRYVLSELESKTEMLEALTVTAKVLNEKLASTVKDLSGIREALERAERASRS